MPIPYCFNYNSFVIWFVTRKCDIYTFILLSQDSFDYSGSLWLQDGLCGVPGSLARLSGWVGLEAILSSWVELHGQGGPLTGNPNQAELPTELSGQMGSPLSSADGQRH